MRYAKEEYWIAKEEHEQYEAEQEYELTDDDIADILYREARESGEFDWIFGN